MNRLLTRAATAAALLAGILTIESCTDAADIVGGFASPYRSQTSEDNVLHNLQVSWREREITEYAKLLAADYRYFPDAATQDSLDVEFLDRGADSTAVECLFKDADVTKLTIDLSWPLRSARPAGFQSPRHTWTRIVLADLYLDIGLADSGGEVTTFRVRDASQAFFFRRGRMYPPSGPADTLVYLVEWRDQASSAPGNAATQEPPTWSAIKTRCR